MIGVITRPVIVATILFGVWRALGRTNVSARARVSAWWWIVVFLAGWLVTVWLLAVRGAFASLSNSSAIAQVAFVPLVILILLGAALFAATRSAVLTAALDAAPLSWLVGIQVYRVLGWYSCWPGHGDSCRDTSLCPPESETHLWACWLSRWRLVFGRIRRSFVDSRWVGTFWESSIW